MTMDTAESERQLAEFARTRIRKDLAPDTLESDSSEFPTALWSAMGAAGLLDPEKMAPEAGTGASGRCRRLTRAARILAQEGGSLGLTLSWIIHQLTAGIILDPAGSGSHRRELVRDLKTGAATLSFAVSEPQGGGHPKTISTRAHRQGEDWVITGEKTYLTNGPIARAFVVIAVTGRAGDKKEFSAFLVDRDTPGLEVLPPMDIPFFRPSPHGGIRLDNCRVGPEALVGVEGRAYEGLVLRFRQLEDALMTGAVTGAMAALVGETARAVPRDLMADGTCQENLGRLAAMADTAGVLSERIAGAVDEGEVDREGLHLVFRELAAAFLQTLDTFPGQEAFELGGSGAVLRRDLKASAKLGETVARLRLKKLGRRLLGQGV